MHRVTPLSAPVHLPRGPSRALMAFCQRLNSTTGKLEWAPAGDEYEYTHEILTSQYGDMVHDYERVRVDHPAFDAGNLRRLYSILSFIDHLHHLTSR